LLKQIIYQVQD